MFSCFNKKTLLGLSRFIYYYSFVSLFKSFYTKVLLCRDWLYFSDLTKGQHLAAAAETLSSSKPLKRFRKGLTL